MLSDEITVINKRSVINLTENREILSSDTNIAETFNDYFSNVSQNLKIPRENSLLNMDLCINLVLAATEKYKHHQSIISINEIRSERGQAKFSFYFVTLEETIIEVALLSDKKASKLQIFQLK